MNVNVNTNMNVNVNTNMNVNVNTNMNVNVNTNMNVNVNTNMNVNVNTNINVNVNTNMNMNVLPDLRNLSRLYSRSDGNILIYTREKIHVMKRCELKMCYETNSVNILHDKILF